MPFTDSESTTQLTNKALAATKKETIKTLTKRILKVLEKDIAHALEGGTTGSTIDEVVASATGAAEDITRKLTQAISSTTIERSDLAAAPTESHPPHEQTHESDARPIAPPPRQPHFLPPARVFVPQPASPSSAQGNDAVVTVPSTWTYGPPLTFTQSEPTTDAESED